jgi:HD-like signal output (HDOD) protein
MMPTAATGGETVIKDRFIDRLEAIDDLPSLPEIVTRLTRAIENPNTSANDVAAIMQDDPAITAKVLKLVNSAFYGPVASAREITSVPYAVARMGFNEVRNVVLTMSVFSMFNKRERTIDRREFWRHCISVGITTKVIYNHAAVDSALRDVSPDTYFVAGLLHDVGIIVLEQYFHKSFAALCAYAQHHGLPLHKAEEEKWDVSHGDIGAFLCKKWNMPMPVVEAINFHHQPLLCDDAFRKIVSVVHLADFICNSQNLGDSTEGMFDGFAPESLVELGISVKHINDIIDVVIEESAKSEILLSLAM